MLGETLIESYVEFSDGLLFKEDSWAPRRGLDVFVLI
jgi:hypothetical protein